MNKEELDIIFQGVDKLTPVAQDVAKATQDVEKATKDTDTAFRGFAKAGDIATNALKGLALGGIALVGTAIGAVGVSSFNLSSDIQKSQGEIQASLGVTAEDAKELSNVAKDIFGNNFGTNFEDAKNAVIEVRSQLRGLTNKELQQVAEGAFAIRDTFKAEIGQTTNAVKALMDNFGVSSEKALNMIAQGFQVGLNSSGDFLESITEYSNQFKEGGATADEFFNTLASGLGTGVVGTDKAGDLFKEFVVRIQDGSKTTSDALKLIGLDSKQLSKDLADGTIEPIDAFNTVIATLAKTDDENKVMQAGVGLLGAQFEDLGKSVVISMDLQSDVWGENGKSLNDLNKRYNNFGDIATGMWREVLLAVEPYMAKLVELANKVMPKAGKTTEIVKKAIDGLIKAFKEANKFYNENKLLVEGLALVIGSLATAIGIITGLIWLWTTATTALATAQGILNGLFIASPIGWFTLALAGLIAVGVLLYKNWDTIKAKGSELFGWLVRAGTVIKDSVVNSFKIMANQLSNIWSGIKNVAKGSINFIIDGINSLIKGFNGIKIDIPKWVPKMGGKSYSANIPPVERFAKGGDFVTNGPQMVMVGDNMGGKERVSITPISSKNYNGPSEGGLTINLGGINFSGNFMGTERDRRNLANDLADAINYALKKKKYI